MIVGYAARSYLIGRARERRLEMGEGQLLGKPLMEAGVWFVGTPVVNLLHAIGATPNMVTIFSLLPAAGAGVAVATGHFGVGALLMIAAGLCDLFDGMLARRLGTGSDAGEVIDAATDRYTEFFVLAGLTMYFRGIWWLELLALAAILGSFMISYSTAKAEALGLPPPKGIMRRAERTFFLATGATFTPVIAPLWPPELAGRIEIYSLPMLVPLALVAILGNISALVRFEKTARMARDRARSHEPAAPPPKPAPQAASPVTAH
jgi:CDP-diacylglycerol--glycerol-3-phosphate 3-phosphatidyltransferase